MPWTCSACAVEVLDDHPACPACGAKKSSWTLHAERTRTLAISTPRLVVLRGERAEPLLASEVHLEDVVLHETDEAPALLRADVLALHRAGRRPAPRDVVFVRSGQDPDPKRGYSVTVEFARQAVESSARPWQRGGWWEARLVFVRGPEPAGWAEVAFPGLELVCVHEDGEPGHAPTIELEAQRKRRELRVVPRGAPAPAPPPGTAAISVEDLCFETDRALLLPRQLVATGDAGADRLAGLAALRAVLVHAARHPERVLLAAGHTDTAGRRAYNLGLAAARAEGAHLFLSGQREAWAAHCQARYEVADVQEVLAWVADTFGWETDPGPIDGQWGERSRAARDALRARLNAERGAGLAQGTKQSAADWAQVYDLYDEALAALLSEAPAALARRKQALRWASPPVLACGEAWPVDAPGVDGRASARNRRVELLFLAPDEVPALPGDPPGAPLYGEGTPPRRYVGLELPALRGEVHLALRGDLGIGPLARRPYVLELPDGPVEGETDDEGLLRHRDLPPGDYPFSVTTLEARVAGYAATVPPGAAPLVYSVERAARADAAQAPALLGAAENAVELFHVAVGTTPAAPAVVRVTIDRAPVAQAGGEDLPPRLVDVRVELRQVEPGPARDLGAATCDLALGEVDGAPAVVVERVRWAAAAAPDGPHVEVEVELGGVRGRLPVALDPRLKVLVGVVTGVTLETRVRAPAGGGLPSMIHPVRDPVRLLFFDAEQLGPVVPEHPRLFEGPVPDPTSLVVPDERAEPPQVHLLPPYPRDVEAAWDAEEAETGAIADGRAELLRFEAFHRARKAHDGAGDAAACPDCAGLPPAARARHAEADLVFARAKSGRLVASERWVLAPGLSADPEVRVYRFEQGYDVLVRRQLELAEAHRGERTTTALKRPFYALGDEERDRYLERRAKEAARRAKGKRRRKAKGDDDAGAWLVLDPATFAPAYPLRGHRNLSEAVAKAAITLWLAPASFLYEWHTLVYRDRETGTYGFTTPASSQRNFEVTKDEVKAPANLPARYEGLVDLHNHPAFYAEESHGHPDLAEKIAHLFGHHFQFSAPDMLNWWRCPGLLLTGDGWVRCPPSATQVFAPAVPDPTGPFPRQGGEEAQTEEPGVRGVRLFHVSDPWASPGLERPPA